MFYWRLVVRRPFSNDQVIDLRTQSSVFVGDSYDNDVCVDSTIVPGRLKVVSRFLNKISIHLTEEVIPSLSGEFHEKKSWATRLYRGHRYEAKGPMSWKIGDAEFRLVQVEPMAMSAPIPLDTKVERKHWTQSMVGAVLAHCLLILFLMLFRWISGGPSDQNEIAMKQIQKVSIVQAAKVFEEPKVPEFKEADQGSEAEGEIAALSTEDSSTKKDAGGTNAKGSEKGRIPQVAKKVKVPQKPNVEKMGLLALQTTAQPKKTNIDITAVATGATVSTFDKSKPLSNADLGLASASDDMTLVLGKPSSDQVAALKGSGIAAYQGGLTDKVKKGVKRGASIRLVKREIEIRGGLDPAVIRQIIEERLPEVRYCYETALLRQSSLEGKIAASWTIMPDGSVSDMTSESDEIKGDILHPCIRSQIKKWKFPSPKGGGVVKVKYPFLFSPIGS